MTITKTGVHLIAIDAINVINPRTRSKKGFNDLVTSIENLGLKRPITVARRADGEYDLVCGQGRLEAYRALGQDQIPAMVVEASEEDCYIMSLVENLARRRHSSTELMHDIGALRQRGYSVTQIALKTGFSDEYVSAICFLLDHGEERLLAAVDRGAIPPSIAREIARAKEADVQRALAEAYETKTLPGNQVLTIRRIIEQRKLLGKTTSRMGQPSKPKKQVTANSLVRAYQKEIERQKRLVKKADISEKLLLFVVSSLQRLLADEGFVSLLRAEGMQSLPRPLLERLGIQEDEDAARTARV
jgi:ParB family chromosome partitioning protein